MFRIKIIIVSILLLFFSCNEGQSDLFEADALLFDDPLPVTVMGYEDNVMEPFLSRDGSVLFFNNLNAPSENTNLHWCIKQNDTVFQYMGELRNVNTDDLEGVPSMDVDNNLYFVYTGDYEETLSTIYKGMFTSGNVNDVKLVSGISRRQAGWVNFDVEVSNDGQTLYFVDGRFDADGGPYESDLVMATKQEDGFVRLPNSEKIFENINTDALEYAAAISKDELEICFTRVAFPLNKNSSPKIYIATRNTKAEAFSNVVQLGNLTGFVEAGTYSPDDNTIYFHKRENGLFKLFLNERR